MDARLIEHPAAEASWNMAVDQALLDTADHRAILRFYQWAPAAVSLGYFQRAANRDAHPASRELAFVRRPSGGGAIVHDRELTYCLVLPITDRFLETEQLVLQVHRTLLAALREWGIAATLCAPGGSPGEPPFLCFQRREKYDVLLDGKKIAGSAQRRQRDKALLHGSVLLNRSPFAPELPGINEISGRSIVASQLSETWAAQLAASFRWRCKPGRLERPEIQVAEQVHHHRYRSDAWNRRR